MIYIHVPFCRSFCSYCAFYSEILGGGCEQQDLVRKEYVPAVITEIHNRREEIVSASDPRTLYIGGGTPSVLSRDVLETIVRNLPQKTFDEFTMEANPEDLCLKGRNYVTALMDMGVDRISLGIQSFDDSVLKRMRRRHNALRALEAVETVREGGIRNLSIDLMFGMEGMDDGIWENTLHQTISLRPEHISAYQLSLDSGSVLSELAPRGEYKEPTDEQCARQYALLCRMLSEAGYIHYEISNFALPGHEALHNSAYWTRRPYVGLGPGAHSFDGRRTRSWNSEMLPNEARSSRGTKPNEWMESSFNNVSQTSDFHGLYTSESEILSEEDIRVETIMLGLRTAAGLPIDTLRSLTDPTILSRLIRSGCIVSTGSNLRIPESRFFISDEIIRELI